MAFQDKDWLSTENAVASPSQAFDDQKAASSNMPGKGSWHVVLSAVTLAAATLVSTLLALATQGIPQRAPWLMGIIFMAPAVAVLLGALMVEERTDAMTPRFNRGAQAAVALITAAVAFMTGCLGDIIYQYGFVQPTDIVFVMDRSVSMSSNDPSNESASAVQNTLSAMSDNARAGLVLFSDTVMDTVPLAKLTQGHRRDLLNALATPTDGSTNFYLPLSAALDMVNSTGSATNRKMSIVIVTDGEESEADITKQLSTHLAEMVIRCKAADISVSCVKLTGLMDPSIQSIVQSTGGTGVLVSNAAQLAGGLANISVSHPDLLRDQTPAATATAGVLLVLEGLVLGFALTLMLSHQRQKRLQLLLSPLMGLAAFVLCKLLAYPLSPVWVNEALMFALFGIVLMRKNRSTNRGITDGGTETIIDTFF